MGFGGRIWVVLGLGMKLDCCGLSWKCVVLG